MKHLRNQRFAIVVSEFNTEVTDKLLQGAIDRLLELAVVKECITVIRVPGAVEIPLAAKMLAKTEIFQAIICLGAVIRGETDHYDYVCQMVSEGCLKVMLKHEIPVIFGVLTTDDEAQALERTGGKHGHKGVDAVDAAFKMLAVIEQVREL